MKKSRSYPTSNTMSGSSSWPLNIEIKDEDITNSSVAVAVAAPSHSNLSSNEMKVTDNKRDEIIDEELATIMQMPNYSTVPSKSSCCIYTVPEYIKKEKEECYRPLVISIGPVFVGDRKLKAMEHLKYNYVNAFIRHPDNAAQGLAPYIKFLREHEMEIRECYQDEISLESEELVRLIAIDAIFLIQLFLYVSNSQDGPCLNAYHTMPEKPNKLIPVTRMLPRDLFLLENQIPYFVLQGIYDIAFPKLYPRESLLALALEYTAKLQISSGIPVPHDKEMVRSYTMNEPSISHLVDLWRRCYYYHCSPFEFSSFGRIIMDNRFHKFETAKKLSASGVKFRAIESKNLFDITFDKDTGVLKMPKLSLFHVTESFLRSITYFEECNDHYSSKIYFLDYIYFLDKLIDSVEDIQILQQHEILDNELGSDEDVAHLFNRLTKHLHYSDYNFRFSGVSKDLKDYSSRRWNRWKAIFRTRYFNHPWAAISVIYAIILFILTVIQTITSFTSK